jgi:hypothetical protein
MNTAPESIRLVRLSERVYRSLLSLYPPAFRREYSEWMMQLFSDCCCVEYRAAGPGGLIRLWVRTFIDFLSSIVEEYMNRNTDMNRGKFARLSGAGLILGAITLVITGLASARPDYAPYSAVSLPIDRYLKAGVPFTLILGILLISLGQLGLLLRWGKSVSAFGRAFLAAGIVCGVGACLSFVVVSINDTEPWWIAFILFFAGLYAGAVPAGWEAWRVGLLRGLSGIALTAIILLPALMLIKGIAQLITGQGDVLPGSVDSIVLLASTAGLAWLGFELVRRPRQGPGQAAPV